MIKGSELENRGPAASGGLHGGEEATDDPQRAKAKRGTKDADSPSLAERIAAARNVKPNYRVVHCGHCFGIGRDEAIRTIVGASEEAS
jgi:hypothetical protein